MNTEYISISFPPLSPLTHHGLRQVSVDALDKLEKLVYLGRYGGSVLLVQLNDDPQTHKNIVLVLNLFGGGEREGGVEGREGGNRDKGEKG